MKKNDLICGFRIKEINEISELKATLYTMEYEKNGCQLVWLDNGEENKLFSITFKTLPQDDTGVFHILEHSVLCGSKHYPVKEPFVELLKSSMNTFLNAMTFPDKTMFPVSSRNEQDFLNLMHVYLDAVFYPAIYTNPNIFYQEGWHYELLEKENNPIYKGVVFNEMKGSFSSVDTMMNAGINRLLFPDNCYQYVAGGEPSCIVDLTYENFIKAHEECYHPSNAKIYLDGNVPIEKVLHILDKEYLSQFETSDIQHVINYQENVSSSSHTDYYEIGEEEDTKFKVHMGLGKVICDWKDRKTQMALLILGSYLTGTNEAPMKKAILQSGLAQDMSMNLYDNIAQPYSFIHIQNTEYEHRETIKKIIKQVIHNILDNGFNKEELEAIINQFEFQLLESGEPKALTRNIVALSSWLYGGNPLQYLENNSLLKELRNEIHTGYYENILKTIFDDTMCEYYLLPSNTKGMEDAKKENERLKKTKEYWSQEEISHIIDLNKNLLLWQEKVDTPEELKVLPVLSLDQIKPELDILDTQELEINNIKVLYHPVSEAGITHFNLYFTMTDIDVGNISTLSFLTNLLGQLPTKNYNVETLQREIKKTIGFLDYNIQVFSVYDHHELCNPYFVVSCSALDDKVDDAIKLICEIVNNTDYTSDESVQTIWEILMQCVEGMRQSIIEEGHRFALKRCMKHFSAHAHLQEKIEGYQFYLWLLEFAQNFNDKINDFVSYMIEVQNNIFELNHLTATLTCCSLNNQFQELVSRMNKVECQVSDTMYIDIKEDNVKEMIELPFNISYCASGAHLSKYHHKHTGSLRVLSTILTYDYLWNEIRVQGGAYGCGFQVGTNGNIGFYSYRDPDPLHSQEVYTHSSEFMQYFIENVESLDKYIISTIASLDPLQTIRQKGINEDFYYFSGISKEERISLLKEILNVKKEDLLACCHLLDDMAKGNANCIVGNVESLTDDWKVYKL